MIATEHPFRTSSGAPEWPWGGPLPPQGGLGQLREEPRRLRDEPRQPPGEPEWVSDGPARPWGGSRRLLLRDNLVAKPEQASYAARVTRNQDDVYPRRWTALVVMMLCLIVISLDNTILNVALRTIQQDLHASGADMQWAINSYTLAFAALMFTFGLLGDRFGRRLVLMCGLAVFAAGSAMSAWTTSPHELITTRAVMGVGAATMLPTTLSIITTIFPVKERPRAIGLWSAAVGVGVAIGPVAGGYLLEHWWWGSIFLVNVPFVLVGLVAIALVVPESRDPHPVRTDPLGVVLSTAGIVAVVFGVIRAGDLADWTSPQVLGPIVGGVVLLVVFALVEQHSDHPAFDVRLFANRAFTAASVSVALVFFALMGMAFVLSYYLQLVRDRTPLQAGVALLPAAVGIAAGSAGAPALVRRLGVHLVVPAGMLLSSAGFCASLVIDRTTPTWYYEACIFAVPLGVGLALSPATEVVVSQLPRDRPGAGAAMNGTLRLVGASLGVAVLGALLSGSYRHAMSGPVSVLPSAARHDAAGSIGATATTIQQLAADARKAFASGQLSESQGLQLKNELTGLMNHAADAFVSATHAANVCGAAVGLLGALVAALWLPRPGRKEPPIGRTTSGGSADERSAETGRSA